MSNLPFILDPALPEVFLAIVGLALLIVGVALKDKGAATLTYMTMMALTTTLFLLLSNDWQTSTALNEFFILDTFAGFVKMLIITGMIEVLALSMQYLQKEKISCFEYPILALFATLGMMMMVSANDLLSLYIGLELQSLSLYVMAAIRRNSLKSAEAGIKYFILGALSSGMILFGSSIVYGFAGTTNFDQIANALMAQEGIALGVSLGLVFILSGIAFKISAAPFHMWTPDVYEGAPTAVTALFAIVPKLAAVALLMRILLGPFAELTTQWTQILWFLAAASMIVGAFAALNQENIKRLLAYSSIGNMGYAMLGLIAGTPEGAGAVVFYFTIYMVMTAGTFGIIIALRRGGVSIDKINCLSGLSRTHPVSAYALAILMLSMTGIPPFAGFFGKLFIFQSAIEAGFIAIAVIGVLTSVVAAYYYLRIIKVMFFDEAVETLERDSNMPRTTVVILSLSVVMTLIYAPEPLLMMCQSAAFSLF